jgi:hypothetical protein
VSLVACQPLPTSHFVFSNKRYLPILPTDEDLSLNTAEISFVCVSRISPASITLYAMETTEQKAESHARAREGTQQDSPQNSTVNFIDLIKDNPHAQGDKEALVEKK